MQWFKNCAFYFLILIKRSDFMQISLNTSCLQGFFIIKSCFF